MGKEAESMHFLAGGCSSSVSREWTEKASLDDKDVKKLHLSICDGAKNFHLGIMCTIIVCSRVRRCLYVKEL